MRYEAAHYAFIYAPCGVCHQHLHNGPWPMGMRTCNPQLPSQRQRREIQRHTLCAVTDPTLRTRTALPMSTTRVQAGTPGAPDATVANAEG